MFPIAAPIRKSCAAVAVLLAAGCATIPAVGPRPEIRDASTVEASQSLAVTDSRAWPTDEWWMQYGDPQLDALIAEALANSPDVAAAAARFRRAAGVAMEAGGARLPSVDASASAYEDRRSLNNGFSDEIRRFLPSGWRSGDDASVRAGFDLDLWGRNRAAHAAATSQMRAAAIDAMEARLMLASAVALAYADLGELHSRRDIRQSALELRTASRDLVSKRLVNGLETRGSLRQADAQVATARADLAEADALILLRRHQIAALLGAGPDRGLAIGRPRSLPALPTALPQGVTTDLVARRPDIVAARERAEAAARQVDVARADFFPAIRLDALIGLQSIGLSSLFESASTYGRAGPAVNLPLFHGGALRGRYRQSRASFDEAVANYDRAVLDAYRELADVVTRRAAVASRLADAREALAASEDAYAVAMLRYRGGLSGYLEALQVEDRLLVARLGVSNLAAEARALDIALIRALGGGFASENHSPAKEAIDG